jgi:hypothetical protein
MASWDMACGMRSFVFVFHVSCAGGPTSARNKDGSERTRLGASALSTQPSPTHSPSAL